MSDRLYLQKLAEINKRLTPEVVHQMNENGRLLVQAFERGDSEPSSRDDISEASRCKINRVGGALARAFGLE